MRNLLSLDKTPQQTPLRAGDSGPLASGTFRASGLGVSEPEPGIFAAEGLPQKGSRQRVTQTGSPKRGPLKGS